MTSGDKERLSASDGETLEALFDHVEAQGWCPMRAPGIGLWEVLVARSRECVRAARAPLILAAWHEAPLLMKRVRLLDQLEWAADMDSWMRWIGFLRALPVNEWFQGDAVPNREDRKRASLPCCWQQRSGRRETARMRWRPRRRGGAGAA